MIYPAYPWGGGYTKSEVDTLLNGKADSSHTHSKSQITDFPSYGTTANTICEGNDSRLSDARTPTSHTHTKSEITDFPTIPTVNNATLTIQKNGTTVKTFTANASTDVTCNISVPTKTSDLTNDSGFLTSHQDLSGYVPLSGTNALSGSIVPDTDNSVELGASSKNIKMIYTKGITINGTQFLPSDYVTLNDAQTIPGNKTFSGLTKTTGKLPYSYLGNDLNNAIYNMETAYWGPDTANRPSTSDCGTLLSLNCEGNVHTSNGIGWMAQFGIGTDLRLYLRTKTNTYGSWENWKEFITINEAVPRSGGAVLTGTELGRTDNTNRIAICSGTDSNSGGNILLYPNALGDANNSYRGAIGLYALTSYNVYKAMFLYPDGTWTWGGTAVQLQSDRRVKQQISKIDNALLDAWEDVDLVQFKYNDAVNEKGDNARLHTGYVVQQIDEACQKHNIDISEYGLYCHEEYPEETEEVEVTQDDGTTSKETKVIREASEHYSLRYTETLVVECAYLRRENARLKERLQSHDEYFSNIEKRLQSLENS